MVWTTAGWTVGAVVLVYLLLLASRLVQTPVSNKGRKDLERSGDDPPGDRPPTSAPPPAAR